MAIAHITNWIDTLAASRESGAAWVPSALPPIPGEDVFFQKKQIDNSRVHKAYDVDDRRTCVREVVSVVVIVFFLFALFAPSIMSREASSELRALEMERQDLTRASKELEASINKLRSPEHLRFEAARRGFDVREVARRQQHLNPSAEDAAREARLVGYPSIVPTQR